MLTAVELRAQLPARIEHATELAGEHKRAHFFEAVDVKRAAFRAGRRMLASEQRRFDKLWNEGQRLQELEDELGNKASRSDLINLSMQASACSNQPLGVYMDVLGGLRIERDRLKREAKAYLDDAESRNEWTADDEDTVTAKTDRIEQIDRRIRDIESAESHRSMLESSPGYMEYHRLNSGGNRAGNDGAGGPALPTRTEYRALSEGTGSAGGFLVPPQQANEILSYLRKRNAFLAAGPRMIPMLTDEFVYPKIATSATIAQYAENAAITPSDPTFGSVTLRPKASAGLVLVSRQLWDDSTPVSVRESVFQDFLTTMAEHLEAQFLRGDATGSNLTGIRFQTGVVVTSLGANGLGIEIDQILDGLGRLRAAKAGAKPVVFVSQRSVNSLLKKKDTTNDYLFGLSNSTLSIGGVPLVVSDAIPENLTVGTSTDCSEIILADMNEVLIVGENQSPEIAMSEDYAFASLQIAVRIWARYDVQLANAAGVEVITGVRG